MTKNFKKITLSLTASAVLVGNAFALDPITNFDYTYNNGTLAISYGGKTKTIAGLIDNAVTLTTSPDGTKVYITASDSTQLYILNTATGAITSYGSIASSTSNPPGSVTGVNLITDTIEVADNNDITTTHSFTDSVNFAGATLKATGSFTLSKPVYLHDEFNLEWDDSSTFTTVAGGTVDTNGYDVEFSGEVSGVGGLTKTGTGKLTLSGANSYTGDTLVDVGTLEFTGNRSLGVFEVKENAFLNVTGDLTLSNSSIYKLHANSLGESGKVAITGTANLDGTVEVKADSSGTWNETTDYEILSASSVNGTFDSVSSDLAFLDPTLSYEADKVNLTLTRNSTTYSTVANNSVSQSVGSVLDNVTSPNADMQNLITTLNGMNSTQAQTALNQLSGTPLASSITNTVSTSNNIFRAGISSKLASSSIKIDDFRFVSADDSMQSTYELLKEEGFVDEDGNLRQEREYSSWVRVIGAKHKTDGDSIRSSTDTSTKGIQIGFDKQNRDNFLFGVSLAYLDNSIDFSSNEADGEVKTFIGGVYTQKNYDDIFLNFGLNIGKNSSDFSRVTPTGDANADFSSLSMGTDLEVGYNYKLDKSFMLKPSVSANYTRLSQDGYSETGAGGANLTIDKYSTNTQNLGLHLKTEKLFYSNGSTIGNLEFGIGYQREFGDTNKALDARFSAAPTAGSFSINGIEKAKNKFLANVNSAYYLNTKTNLFFSLNGMKSSDEQSLTGVAGLKLSF